MNFKISALNVELNANQLKKYLGFDVLSNFEKEAGRSTIQVGDELVCDLVKFDKDNFELKTVEHQEFYLKKTITLPNTLDTLEILTGSTINYEANPSHVSAEFAYKTNPFLKIKIKDYSDYIETGTPSDMDNIPYYAINGEGGDKVWKDVLEVGYIENETNNGVDYPFLNGNHYVYSRLNLSVLPDMNHNNSYKAYRSYFMRGEISHYSRNINKF